MTERSDTPLGFCEHCGANRIMVGQGHCSNCGQALSQPSELAPDYSPAAVPASPAPVQASATMPEAPAAAPVDPPPAPAVYPIAAPPEFSAGPAYVAATPPADYSYGNPPPAYGPPAGFGQPPAAGPWDGSSPYPGMAPAARRNRAMVPLLAGLGLVALVALGGGIYIVGTSKSAPNASSSTPAGVSIGSAAASSAPEVTLAPTPFVEVTPRITTGILTGTLTSAAGSPTIGIGVILCLQSTTSCTVDVSLQAVTDVTGMFEIDAIPPGSYVVLYSLTGAPSASVTQLTISVNGDSADCLGQAVMGTHPASCQDSIPFGDDDGLQLKNASISLGASGSSLDSGVLYSPKYGLYLSFDGGEPLTVDVTAGNTEHLELPVD